MLFSQATFAQNKIITIHQNGGATVLDEKSVDLKKGMNTFQVEGFINGYQPESIFLYADSSPIQALLLRKGDFKDLIAAYKGSEVTFQLKDNERVTGKLTDLKFGGAFLELKDGSTYFVNLSSVTSYLLPPREVDFLNDDTVFGTIKVDKKQSKDILVWYQTSVFRWVPMYKLILNEKMTEASFQGVAKIDYNGNESVEASSIRLSFGNMNQFRPRAEYSARQYEMASSIGFKSQADELVSTSVSDVGDAYEIALNQKISFQPNQQLQVVQTDVKKLAIKKWYEIQSYGSPITKGKPNVKIEFESNKKAGFENPLAAGQIDIMLLKDNELKSLAADDMRNVGVDEKVELSIGRAMDVLIDEVVLKEDQVTKKMSTQSNKVQVKNNKSEKIKVKFERNLGKYTSITDSSNKFQIENGNVIFWLEIGAGKTVSFTYSTKTEYL